MKVLLRIWDLFFYEGSVVLFQMTLGMMKMKVNCTTRCDTSTYYQCMRSLLDIPDMSGKFLVARHFCLSKNLFA